MLRLIIPERFNIVNISLCSWVRPFKPVPLLLLSFLCTALMWHVSRTLNLPQYGHGFAGRAECFSEFSLSPWLNVFLFLKIGSGISHSSLRSVSLLSILKVPLNPNQSISLIGRYGKLPLSAVLQFLKNAYGAGSTILGDHITLMFCFGCCLSACFVFMPFLLISDK